MGDFNSSDGAISDLELATLEAKAESNTLTQEEKDAFVNKFMYSVSNTVKVGRVIVNIVQPEGRESETVRNDLNALEESVEEFWRWSWPGAASGAVIGGAVGYFGGGGTTPAIALAEAVGLSCACGPALIAGGVGLIALLIAGGLIGGYLAKLLRTVVERISNVEVSLRNLFQANFHAGVRVTFD